MSRRFNYTCSALLLTACAVPAFAQQPPLRAVDPVSGHTYELGPADLWSNAVNVAQTKSLTDVLGIARQGHLVTIGSAYENNFVLSFWTTNAPTVWIGFTDFDTPGNYHWSNNEPVAYTNWRPFEPNNSGGIEHYAQMVDISGLWNDLPDGTLPYVIEYDTLLVPPGVPEPGTVALGISALTGGVLCLLRRRKRA